MIGASFEQRFRCGRIRQNNRAGGAAVLQQACNVAVAGIRFLQQDTHFRLAGGAGDPGEDSAYCGLFKPAQALTNSADENFS